MRELGDEMRVEFAMSSKRFQKMEERFDDIGLRIDGLTHILTLLAGRSHDHEERIATLEGAKE